jgi:Tol biopolymer transport system component
VRRTPSTFCLAAAVLCLAATVPIPSAQAQAFGRNKVQYDTFEWKVLVTDHLEIHFYPEEEELAARAAEYGEAACRHLDTALAHDLSKKIPLVVYGSHYHFRQNNVSPSLVGESTGGFTELFRKRVVLPYAGSESDFRHVIHHELVHAYAFDMLYGGPIRSLFVLQYAFYIPLWFMEGIAEYYSNTWDSEAEMMIRDASISGQLAPFDRIYGGYFVYKSGWSAIGYLVQRHGEDVVPRILRSLQETRDIRESVRVVTGESIEEIGADWLADVRKSTWPAIATLDDPKRVGRRLPGAGSYLRSNPTLSPSGERVVFLSNHSGTPDLYVQSLAAGSEPVALVRGARTGKFESLHPLRSSVGWSPDERYVVVAAQHEARDALYVLDARTGRTVKELHPPLDALERPDWSPTEARFVFTGMKSGQVDLYAMDADGTNLEQLTNDLAEERGPRWSPDGTRVAFASDRRAAEDASTDAEIESTDAERETEIAEIESEHAEDASEHDLDLWMLQVSTGRVERGRAADGDQWDPTWSSDGRSLLHVSDEWGTRDLMRVHLDDGRVERLSAFLGGVDSPSAAREGSALAFTVYDRGTFDVAVIDDVDTLQVLEAPAVTFPEHPWDGFEVRLPLPAPELAGAEDSDGDDGAAEAEDAAGDEDDGAAQAIDSTQVAALEPTDASDDALDGTDGRSYVRGYRPHFRTEWITGAFAYNGFGASGSLQTTITDVLGDHRIYLGSSVAGRWSDTDAIASYAYLPRRFDYEVSVFHIKDYLYNSRTTLGHPIGEEGKREFFSERQWGASASVAYPFHTFRRVGFDVNAIGVERTTYTRRSREFGSTLEEVSVSQSRLVIPRLYHTFDNTLWGWTGPVQGRRSVASIAHSIPFGGDRLSYGTALSDSRMYYRFREEYVLALRLMAVTSFGRDPQEFQLGGPNTLRGYPLQEFRGTSAALFATEFRFPFLEYVKFGWPFRSAFGGIRGDLFVDVGTAFDDVSGLRLTGPNDQGHHALDDLRVGFGVGMRGRVAFFPVRVDVGWPTDGAGVGNARWHFTIGPEY